MTQATRTLAALMLITCASQGLADATKQGSGALPVFSPKRSPWSVGVGVVVRSIKTDFSVPTPSFEPLGAVSRHRDTATGDTALYPSDGDPLGELVINYADGSVGPTYFPADGDVDALPSSQSQYSATSRTYQSTFGGTDRVDDLRFTSQPTEYNYYRSGEFSRLSGSDSDTGLGPQLNLGYEVISRSGLQVDMQLGYSFVQTTHDLIRSLGHVDVVEQRTDTDFTFRYDSVAFVDGAFNIPYAIVNPSVAGGDPFNFYAVASGQPNPFRAPDRSESASTSTRTVASFDARGSADLDVDLHEIQLAAKVLFPIHDRVNIGLVVGPTLNIFQADFSANTEVLRAGGGTPIDRRAYSRDETLLAFGAMAEATAQIDLTREGRWLAELRIGYRWVDQVDLRDRGSSVTIDASSLSASAGIVRIF